MEILEQVMSLCSHDLRVKFVKGECCWVMRELFAGRSWDRYRELTSMALQLFRAAGNLCDHGVCDE